MMDKTFLFYFHFTCLHYSAYIHLYFIFHFASTNLIYFAFVFSLSLSSVFRSHSTLTFYLLHPLFSSPYFLSHFLPLLIFYLSLFPSSCISCPITLSPPPFLSDCSSFFSLYFIPSFFFPLTYFRSVYVSVSSLCFASFLPVFSDSVSLVLTILFLC